MKSELSDPAQQASDAVSIRRRWLLLLLRVTVLLLVLACLWLIYPFAKTRVCLSLVARSYDTTIDPKTGSVVRISRQARTNKHFSMEAELADQPLSALLELLPSGDPVRVFVVGQAIEQQITQGRYPSGLAGLHGKREPVELDPESLEVILDVMDKDLPSAALEPLMGVLRHVRNQPADRIARFNDCLLKATKRSSPESRCFGIQIIGSMKLDSDETLELVSMLANDPDDNVREALFAQLITDLRRDFGDQIPDRYRRILQSLFKDGSTLLRLSGVTTLSNTELDSLDVFQGAKSLLADPAVDVRARAVQTMLNAMEAGRINVLQQEYGQAISDAISSIDSAHGHEGFMNTFIWATNVPRNLQWRCIEQLLMSEDDPYRTSQRANMIDALFVPDSLDRYTDANDWTIFRVRFRPLALAAREDFLLWAQTAIQSDDDKMVIGGMRLMAAVAPNEPNRLTDLISHRSSIVRTMTLRSLHPSPEQIPLLLQSLNDADVGVRQATVTALNQYEGNLTQEVIDALMIAFRSEQDDYPIYAWLCLFDKMPLGNSVRDQLIADALQKKRSVNAEHWATAEIKKRRNAVQWLPQLLDGIGEERLGLQSALLVIEAGKPISSSEVATRLFHLVSASLRTSPIRTGGEVMDPWTQIELLLALCQPESVTRIVFDGLITTLTSEHYSLADAKRIVELPIDREAFGTRITTLVDSALWQVRRNSALTLAALGPSAKGATSRLVALLTDSDYHVRIAAADALGSIGQDAGASAAAALAGMAKNDKQPGAQLAAIQAIARMGPLLNPWIPTIDELTRKGDRMVREAASKVLQDRKNAAR